MAEVIAGLSGKSATLPSKRQNRQNDKPKWKSEPFPGKIGPLHEDDMSEALKTKIILDIVPIKMWKREPLLGMIPPSD